MTIIHHSPLTIHHSSHFLVFCYLLLLPLAVTGCADFPSKHELKRAWVPNTEQLLKQPIDLKNCIDRNQQLVAKKITVAQVGVVLHPNMYSVRTQEWDDLFSEPAETQVTTSTFDTSDIGISVIPYIVDENQQKFMLVPKLDKLDKFAPACESAWQGISPEVFKTPFYYPTVVLKVAPEQRELLKTQLQQRRQQECSFGEFTQQPVTPSSPILHYDSLSTLLERVFEPKEAVFLQTFAHVQQVLLQEAGVEFQVQSHTNQVAQEETTAIHGPLPPNTIEIQFIWPQILGKLMISGCQEAQVQGQDYATTCLFTAGGTYHITRTQLPNKPVPITLTWQKELGKLDIPTCQATDKIDKGYRSLCAFRTGQSYRIVPQVHKIQSMNDQILLIISLSAQFDGNGVGEMIQNSLYHVLNELRETTPFTLLTIGAGRQLSPPRLRSEELPSLIINHNSDGLKQKIRQLQFSATDLNALDDLELVDQYMTMQNLTATQVLYITDNMGMLDEPPRKQLGVPLAWHREGITLRVITTERCDVWTNRANAHCMRWQGQEPKTLENILRSVLQR
jgi:hypothetical protein